MMEELKHHTFKRARVGESPAPAAKIGRLENGVRGEHPWHQPSSRIYRVSRATGGKDRHSKVYTAKGLRDRRVRLSVSTAIQFYDLQDRLGYDQPSKAIEWLIKSASAAINELPTLETPFPDYPMPNDKREVPGVGMAIVPLDDEMDQNENQNHQGSKSGCSSTSETSKGSVLSLSRSESRIKARERARERAAKDKGEEGEEKQPVNTQASFTELLTGTSSNVAAATTACDNKPIRYIPTATTADYFSQAGLFGQEQKVSVSPLGMMPFNVGPASAAGHHEMQQFSFLHDHSGPIAAVTQGGYNINFAGLNRGTLQSNSPFQLPHQHLQRLSSVDGSNLAFFLGANAPVTATASDSGENEYPAGFDGRLQLCYGNEYRHSDFKGKGKN